MNDSMTNLLMLLASQSMHTKPEDDDPVLGETSPDEYTHIKYAKFKCGLVIFWGIKSGLSFSSSALISGSFDLPFAFTEVPVCIGGASTSGNGNYVFRVGVNGNKNKLEEINWCLGSGNASAITISDRQFTWLAIGKWK